MDHIRSHGGSRLFVKSPHSECVEAGTERSARKDIAVPAIGALRIDAEERDFLRKPRDDSTHTLDGLAKRVAVMDVVVARKHRNRCTRIPARELDHAQQHAGARIEVSRLHQDVAHREAPQLETRDRKMIAVDDRERSLGSDERCNPPQGRLQQRPRSQNPTPPHRGTRWAYAGSP